MGELGAGGVVVAAAAAGIDVVDRLGEIELLEQVTAEAADVVRLRR